MAKKVNGTAKVVAGEGAGNGSAAKGRNAATEVKPVLSLADSGAAVASPPMDAKRIANRLKRARGQLDALITAFETGATCRDVVTQLAAVSKALDRAGFLIVSTAMQDCLREPTEDGDDGSDRSKEMDIEELEKLFMMLT